MQTKLIYTVIVRKRKTVLCEFTESSGNFSQIVKKVLEKLNQIELSQYRVGFTLENYMFYCILIDKIYIITMATKVPLNSNINDYLFGFVYKIYSITTSSIDADRLMKAPSFSLGELVDKLKDNMNLFNSGGYKVHFAEAMEKNKDIPIEESLNNQIIDTGNPFAILTKTQIHEEQPNELEQSELRESLMICIDTEKDRESNQTFLKEELFFDENNSERNKSSKRCGCRCGWLKKYKWFIIAIAIILLIVAVFLIIYYAI